jgi:ribokinase
MIHVIGNAAVDTVIRMERFPRPGETLVAEQAGDDLGGKGANQAVAIARCGEKVSLVASVGIDTLGERVRTSLAAEGVDTTGLWTWPGLTDRSIVYVDKAGENTIVSVVEAARNFDPLAITSVAREIVTDDWVVLQGNLRPDVTRACLALAKDRGAATVLNPSPAYAANDYDWSLVDLVVLNRGEAIELGGRDDPIEAARHLIATGAGTAVLTLGSAGAIWLSTTEEVRVVAPEVTTLDTVGAGDVFCGALIVARNRGFSWSEALRVAAAAAAICVTRAGVLASFPTRIEMSQIMASSSQMISGSAR